MNFLSRKFGPVFVFGGRMPTFPDTYAEAKNMGDGQVVYWSVGTMGAPPSGQLWDGVFDMMVPLDKDGYYTIVVSRPEDRPKNATRENNVTWIDWGPGEGSNDPTEPQGLGHVAHAFHGLRPQLEAQPRESTQTRHAAIHHGPLLSRGPLHDEGRVRGQR